MRPYGMKIRPGYQLHPHDKCGICRALPPTKGQARMGIKEDRDVIDMKLEYDERYDEDWNQDIILAKYFNQ